MKRFSTIAASIALAALLAVPAFAAQEAKKAAGKTVTTASGLKYVDVVVGKGASPVVGKQVKVHYTGTLKTAKNSTARLTARSRFRSLSASAKSSRGGTKAS